MSRRMLDSAIWSNENFAALPPRGRLLQIGMINIADDQGRLKAHPLYLAKEIFPYDHTEAIDVSKWLEQMVEHGTIELYMVEGKQYAQFRNWWEYQSLQFAHPSSYPRPEGWLDRIRFNGKGNQMLASNWVTPKGDRMIDTCDQDGRPLPFVMELPRANKAAEAGTRVPTLVPAEVRTLVPAEVPTQVTPNLTNNYQLTTTNLTSNNNNMRALTLKEAEKAVVVVGVPALLNEFDHDQTMALLSWLWLYNGWYEDELSYRDIFRRAYNADPFAGMKQPGAVIVKLARAKGMAPLAQADREDMMTRLTTGELT